MADLENLLVLGGLLLLATPILAIVALVRTFGLKGQVEDLRMRLYKLEVARALAENAPPVTTYVASVPEPPQPISETPPLPEPPPVFTDLPAFNGVPLDRLVDQDAPEQSPIAASVSPASPPPPKAPKVSAPQAVPAPQGGARKLEHDLTERWMVWLGGVTLALGGAFLVKYSAEQGLLGPAARIIMGILSGIGLIALGQWLARRPLAADKPSALPWQVPPALAAGGAAMMFAALYAAYGFYGFLTPGVAFTGLAATAALTVLLSLQHGPLVALLGLAGGFAVPLLVQTGHPNAAGLFSYLFLLSAGSLALLRWRKWWWLSWCVLGGTVAWTIVWMALPWSTGDELAVGPFLLAIGVLFALFRTGLPAPAWFAGRAEHPMVRVMILTAAAILASLAVLLVARSDFSTPSLAVPLLLTLGLILFAMKDQHFDFIPGIAVAMAVGVLTLWNWMPDTLDQSLTVAGLFGLLFAASGFVVLRVCAHPWRWAALSAGGPLAVLATLYWRQSTLHPFWSWPLASLVLAVLAVAATERLAQRRHLPGQDKALAAYAVGTIAALALTATFVLQEAWLTVSLSGLLLGIAWVERRLAIPELRRTALLLAGAVLVRLILNPYVLHYPIGEAGVLSWLLYGYGLPALAFAGAALLFRRSADDLLVSVLEAGTIAFTVLLVSLNIRHLVAGSLDYPVYGLHEASLNTIAWLSGSAGLFLIHRRSGRLVPLRAGQLLMLAGSLQAVLLQALLDNPLSSGDPVGNAALFNQLLISFGLPAVLYAVHVVLVPQKPTWLRPASAFAALAFALLWASLEVRHAFVGSVLDAEPVTQAEQWSYSILWLTSGVLTLLGGIRARVPLFRQTGLAIVLAVVAKVFLIDLSETEGLWRALSFLGLGLTLVGIGWLYRRFVRTGTETA